MFALADRKTERERESRLVVVMQVQHSALGMRGDVQGDTSRCFKPPVDISFKAALLYDLLILKRNFQNDVNMRFSLNKLNGHPAMYI